MINTAIKKIASIRVDSVLDDHKIAYIRSGLIPDLDEGLFVGQSNHRKVCYSGPSCQWRHFEFGYHHTASRTRETWWRRYRLSQRNLYRTHPLRISKWTDLRYLHVIGHLS